MAVVECRRAGERSALETPTPFHLGELSDNGTCEKPRFLPGPAVHTIPIGPIASNHLYLELSLRLQPPWIASRTRRPEGHGRVRRVLRYVDRGIVLCRGLILPQDCLGLPLIVADDVTGQGPLYCGADRGNV